MVMHPVGPLPASTYWRRRLVLLAALVLLLWVAKSVLGGGGGAAGHPSASPSSSPRPTVSTSPRPSPTKASGPLQCRDQVLKVTTASDATSYPVGTSPRFTVTVTNTGAVTCRRDLGPLELVVKSGADRIWASTDCAPRATRALQGLGPGGSLETVKTWDGKRSRPGCSGTRSPVKAGTYTVRATIGTLTSTLTVFRLTAAA
jgi:hypothetical protein